MLKESITTCYIDGSCRFNPGPGAYAIVMHKDNKISEFASKKIDHTTNNRMELQAGIRAFLLLGKKGGIIYTDSRYLLDGYNK
jgi:ribonuclease HI